MHVYESQMHFYIYDDALHGLKCTGSRFMQIQVASILIAGWQVKAYADW